MLAIAALLTGMASINAAGARDDDRDQPATIEADRAEIDRSAGLAQYRGDAVFNQGSLRVTGERITVEAEQGQIENAKSQGSPATIQQRNDAGRLVRGRAQRIRYDARSPLVTLLGDAELVRGGDNFSAGRIEYHPDTGRIDAQRDDSQRVRIRMEPVDDEPTENDEDVTQNGG
jgi:lipopolysaccharide export system protein LptA